MKTTLTKTERMILAGCLLAGLLFLIPGVNHFKEAFSEIHIDFPISKDNARELGRAFLSKNVQVPDDYREAIAFDVNESAKIFLEREIGLDQMGSQLKGMVDIWGWYIRWFKPLEKETFTVSLSPDGNLILFDHEIPEEQSGSTISEQNARTIAQQFISEYFAADITQYRLVESNVQERPNRLDRNFVWELNEFDIHGATVRIQITVAGDKIIHAKKFLKIPEVWLLDFQKLRSGNMFYQMLGNLGAFVLFTGAIILLFKRMKNSRLQWIWALWAGVTVGVVYSLNIWNMLPLQLVEYDTTNSMTSFIIHLLMGFMASAAGTALVLLLFISIGEVLYRESYPNHIRLNQIFRWKSWQTKETFQSIIAGYGLVMFHVGFVVMFYVWGKKLGVWAPAEINYTNAISSVIPVFLPLAISLWAASVEEFIFRMFAIPFLQKLTRSTFLAVIIPAFTWGFLHSAYPQQPGFIRGVEVGLIGVIAGFVMLRFGILATLLWHFVMDSIFIGLFMFESGQTSLLITGIFLCAFLLVPLAVVTIGRLRRGGFAPSDGYLNRDFIAPLKETSIGEAKGKRLVQLPAFSTPTRIIAVLVTLFSTALVYGIQSTELGSQTDLRVSIQQVTASADSALKKMGGEPSGFQRATWFENAKWTDGLEYIRETAGMNLLSDAFRHSDGQPGWVVRYFNILEKTQYYVYLDTIGTVTRVQHILPEDASGANLPAEDARILAQELLTSYGFNVMELTETENTETKLPHRTDHVIEYRNQTLNLGEAQARISVNVMGDRAFGPNQWIKPPENWKVDNQKQFNVSWRRIVHILRFLFIASGVLWALLKFLSLFKQDDFAWQPGLKLGFILFGFNIVELFNQMQPWFSQYSTTDTLANYYLSLFVGRLTMFSLQILMVILCVSLIHTLWRKEHGAGLEGVSPMVDSWLGVITLTSGTAGAYFLKSWMTAWMNIPLIRYPLRSFYGLDSSLPFVSTIVSSLQSALMFAPIALIVVVLIHKGFRKPGALVAILIVFSFVDAVAQVKYIHEWFHFGLVNTLYILILLGLIFLLRAMAPRMYIWSFFWGSAIMTLLPLLRSGSGWYRINGIAAILSVVFFTWLIWWLSRRKTAIREFQKSKGETNPC